MLFSFIFCQYGTGVLGSTNASSSQDEVGSGMIYIDADAVYLVIFTPNELEGLYDRCQSVRLCSNSGELLSLRNMIIQGRKVAINFR